MSHDCGYLSLPRFDPGVPASGQIVIAPDGPIRVLAEALILEGLLVELPEPLDNHGISAAVRLAITNYIHGEVRTFKAFNPVLFSTTYTCDAIGPCGGFNGGMGEEADGRGAFIVEKEPGFIKRRTMGAQILAMEAACKGLGAAVVQIVQFASDYTGSIFTPNDAQGLCQAVYWRGEIDETYYLDEVTDECYTKEIIAEVDAIIAILAAELGCAQKDIVWEFDRAWVCKEYSITTKEYVDKRFEDCPEWVKYPYPKRGESAALLPIPTAPREWRTVADLAQRLAGAIAPLRKHERWEFNHTLAYEFTGGLPWHLALLWSKTDPMLQIFDDAHNDVAQQGGDDNVGPHFISSFIADDVESIREALRRLREYFRIIHILDELIRHISTPF